MWINHQRPLPQERHINVILPGLKLCCSPAPSDGEQAASSLCHSHPKSTPKSHRAASRSRHRNAQVQAGERRPDIGLLLSSPCSSEQPQWTLRAERSTPMQAGSVASDWDRNADYAALHSHTANAPRPKSLRRKPILDMVSSCTDTSLTGPHHTLLKLLRLHGTPIHHPASIHLAGPGRANLPLSGILHARLRLPLCIRTTTATC